MTNINALTLDEACLRLRKVVDKLIITTNDRPAERQTVLDTLEAMLPKLAS